MAENGLYTLFINKTSLSFAIVWSFIATFAVEFTH